MSDNIENYFYHNRKAYRELYFREWLPNVYLPSVKILRNVNLNIAETQYRHGLGEAIELFNRNSSRSNKRRLEEILSQFDAMSKGQRQKIYKDTWSAEKEKNTKIQSKCSENSLSVYIEVVDILQRLYLGTIEVKTPIASGVVDLTGSEDPFAKLLSFGAKQILSRHSFHTTKLPNQISTMLNEFVSSYSDFRIDFDPALMQPISFPKGEVSLQTRRILMTTYDLLEGLRHIWSCRPLLTEDDYSENAYVIHAVSKVLDPLFTYSKWHLKRAWSEQMSKSSQSRKNRMGSINLGKKPDLQILLKLDMKENELVLVEVSRLFPEQDKEGLDWQKLVRICKDCFDERYNIFFEKKDGTSSRAKIIRHELGEIPILGIQVIGERIFVSVLDLFEGAFYRVYRICEIIIPLRISSRQIVEEFLKSALELRTVVEKIVGMSVSIKDQINLLSAFEDRNPSSSIMSTTYSTPRSS